MVGMIDPEEDSFNFQGHISVCCAVSIHYWEAMMQKTYSLKTWGMFLLPAVVLGLLFYQFIAHGENQPVIWASGQSSVQFVPLEDTFVASGSSTILGSNKSFWIGSFPGNFGFQRILLKFDLSQVPANSTISNATLSLFLSGTIVNDPPMNVRAQIVSNDWSEATATWSQYPSTPIDGAIADNPVTSVLGWQNLNLQPIIQAWANRPNRENQLSILLIGYEGGERRERKFVSKECPAAECPDQFPRLNLQFDAPTPTPTATATHTPMPTSTATPLPTATPTSTSTPAPSAGVSISVEPVFSHAETKIFPGSLVTYTVSIHNITGALSDVRLRADAKIVAGTITRTLTAQNFSGGGGIVNDLVAWDIGDIAPGTEASHIYTYSVRVPDGGTLYIPTDYLLNDGATLTWTYPVSNGTASGQASTRPLRNPPFYELILPIVRKEN